LFFSRQLSPGLLDWNVQNDGSIYFCLKLPVLDPTGDLWAFPVGSHACRVTLAYKLKIMLDDEDSVWQRFWKLKNHMQLKLVPRKCTMFLEKYGGHTFAVSPRCEFHFICMDLRSVFELDEDIAELEPAPSPFHVSWVDIA